MSKKKRTSTPAKATPKPASARKSALPEAEPAPPAARERVRDVVKVTPAKGRPMLTWVGKRPLTHVTAFPAQHVEQFSAGPLGAAARVWPDWPAAYPPGGLLFHGDNKEVLAHLLANGFRGKVNLVYIDPPFDSGADYVRKVSLRGPSGSAKLDGERHTLGEQIQYTDIWANDNYLQFMYERLLLLKELLSKEGNIILHCDWHKAHLLRCLLDEVLGADSFKNQIIWRYSKYQMRGMSRFVNNHDVLLWYSLSERSTYNPVTEVLDEPKLLKRKKWDKELERIVNVRDESGELVYDEYHEGKVDDVWELDIIGATSGERLGYPTQKPDGLLDRVVASLSSVDDVVLDCFVGSGTTAASAQRLGRRWIGCDINNGAIQTTAKRLQSVMREQAAASGAATAQPHLPGVDEPASDETPPPAQLSFSVWRVNDYDLQIQHNEAVNLACEHIGVERTRTDSFFDGTLRKQLVKIVPFDHPLSPVDLDEVKREIDARPDDDREITLVCLGIEHAARAWLDDWNRLRKGKNAANRMHVIELRSDERYGAFIRHEPARARVKVRRADSRIVVTIEEFISPSIVERLRQQAGVLQPRIDNWRAMVDCVMIDPAWNGRVFTVALSDIPERKTDLVSGSYDLPAPPDQTTVAVKIVDMLGEEVLFTATV